MAPHPPLGPVLGACGASVRRLRRECSVKHEGAATVQKRVLEHQFGQQREPKGRKKKPLIVENQRFSRPFRRWAEPGSNRRHMDFQAAIKNSKNRLK
jgi:hypothetical protein